MVIQTRIPVSDIRYRNFSTEQLKKFLESLGLRFIGVVDGKGFQEVWLPGGWTVGCRCLLEYSIFDKDGLIRLRILKRFRPFENKDPCHFIEIEILNGYELRISPSL